MKNEKEIKEVVFSDGNKIFSSSLSERKELKNAQYVVIKSWILSDIQKRFQIDDLNRLNIGEILENLYCEKHNIKQPQEQPKTAKPDKETQEKLQKLKKLMQELGI